MKYNSTTVMCQERLYEHANVVRVFLLFFRMEKQFRMIHPYVPQLVSVTVGDASYPYSMLFDGNKVKMARKPGKKQKKNQVGCIGEGKR